MEPSDIKIIRSYKHNSKMEKRMEKGLSGLVKTGTILAISLKIYSMEEVNTNHPKSHTLGSSRTTLSTVKGNFI